MRNGYVSLVALWAQRQTARDLDVDPKDTDKTLQESVKEM
jgi:hypothetical protein